MRAVLHGSRLFDSVSELVVQADPATTQPLLGGPWVVIGGVISALIWVVIILTLLLPDL